MLQHRQHPRGPYPPQLRTVQLDPTSFAPVQCRGQVSTGSLDSPPCTALKGLPFRPRLLRKAGGARLFPLIYFRDALT